MNLRLGVGLLLFAALPSVLLAQSYTVIDLGTLTGGTYSYAGGINNSGLIGGVSTYSNSGSQHTVTFSVANGVVTRTDLGAINNLSSGGGPINDAGQVVGSSQISTGVYHAALFSVTNSTVNRTDLGAFGDAKSSGASGINASGQIVGSSQISSSNTTNRAVLFSVANGSVNLTDLGTLGGNGSTAYGINDSGQIVGQADLTGNSAFHATLFTVANGAISQTDLGTLGGSNSYARGISASGQSAVGASQLISGSNATYHATLFSIANGAVTGRTDLGVLPGGTMSDADSINAYGQIVGLADAVVNGVSGASHGFLYTAASGIQDINNLVAANSSIKNIYISGGNNINDWGQIVGQGSNGQTHAVLLNPVTPNNRVSGAGQDVKLVGGMNYNKTPAFANPTTGSNATMVSVRDGIAGSAGAGTYGLNRDVTATFDSPATVLASRVSDAVNVQGTGGDAFVLQLSYNETLANTLLGGEANARLDWLDPSDNTWKAAVLGNSGGTPFFVAGAYDASLDFRLGYFGVDTANNVVWAVLNHNSDFAVGNLSAVPEPSAWAMMALMAGFGLLYMRRRAI